MTNYCLNELHICGQLIEREKFHTTLIGPHCIKKKRYVNSPSASFSKVEKDYPNAIVYTEKYGPNTLIVVETRETIEDLNFASLYHGEDIHLEKAIGDATTSVYFYETHWSLSLIEDLIESISLKFPKLTFKLYVEELETNTVASEIYQNGIHLNK